MNAAEALVQIARREHQAAAINRSHQCSRQRRNLGGPTAGHRGRFDRGRPERGQQPPRNADEPGRRKHDEADEQQAEIEQPMRRPDRQKFAEQDEEQGAERRPQEASHPADHYHGDELAREGDGQRLGRGKAVIEDRKRTCDRNHCRREHEADQLVAVGWIADEACALFVLADRDEHAADRRAVKAPEQDADCQSDRGDHPVIVGVTLEIDAEHGRSRDAAKSALAARELGPAEGDREQERGERQRQQRKIDAAPAQDQRAERAAETATNAIANSAGSMIAPGNQ